MRIAIIGQQPFAAAVLKAFADRGDDVAGVFCAPEKAGTPPDALRTAAQSLGIPVFQLASLRGADAETILRGLAVDLGVMAYVLQFAPETFVNIPTHGTIQYHPSLLPRHRGPSSINWPIILGETETGLTIFKPTDGLDEGPIVLQKTTPIGADETLGDVYFKRLFPLGVTALLEAADLVTGTPSGSPSGTPIAAPFQATPQDSSLATYEGWCRADESLINWHGHVDHVYNLIRGCDPSPGAWTRFNGRPLQLFAAAKEITRRFTAPRGNVIGSVVAVGDQGCSIAAQGGSITVGRVRYDGGAKMSAQQFCLESGLSLGTVLGPAGTV